MGLMQFLFPTPIEPSVEECKARVVGAQARQAAEDAWAEHADSPFVLSKVATAFLETRDRIFPIGETDC